jgi:hypothetical protein
VDRHYDLSEGGALMRTQDAGKISTGDGVRGEIA